MSPWITLAIIIAAYYAFTAAVVAFNGFCDYQLERNWRSHQGRLKAARQIKYAIVWPVLIPSSKLGHFFEDLWRDMRGGKQ